MHLLFKIVRYWRKYDIWRRKNFYLRLRFANFKIRSYLGSKPSKPPLRGQDPYCRRSRYFHPFPAKASEIFDLHMKQHQSNIKKKEISKATKLKL